MLIRIFKSYINSRSYLKSLLNYGGLFCTSLSVEEPPGCGEIASSAIEGDHHEDSTEVFIGIGYTFLNTLALSFFPASDLVKLTHAVYSPRLSGDDLAICRMAGTQYREYGLRPWR